MPTRQARHPKYTSFSGTKKRRNPFIIFLKAQEVICEQPKSRDIYYNIRPLQGVKIECSLHKTQNHAYRNCLTFRITLGALLVPTRSQNASLIDTRQPPQSHCDSFGTSNGWSENQHFCLTGDAWSSNSRKCDFRIPRRPVRGHRRPPPLTSPLPFFAAQANAPTEAPWTASTFRAIY